MKAAINLSEKFAKFSEHWSPKIIAQMNDYHFKFVKFQGEFVWHHHEDTDAMFIVLDGEMTIHFPDRDVSVKNPHRLCRSAGDDRLCFAHDKHVALRTMRTFHPLFILRRNLSAYQGDQPDARKTARRLAPPSETTRKFP